MTIDTITPIEMNRIEKQVEDCEAGRAKAVTLDARAARALIETYKGTVPVGGAKDLEDELETAKGRIRELESAIEDARSTLSAAA